MGEEELFGRKCRMWRVRERERSEGVMANMQIEEGSPSERAGILRRDTEPTELASEREGVLHLSPSSVCLDAAREGVDKQVC